MVLNKIDRVSLLDARSVFMRNIVLSRLESLMKHSFPGNKASWLCIYIIIVERRWVSET